MMQDPRTRSKLLSPGIPFPVGSDRISKERLFKLERGRIRRTINGRGKWIANGAGGNIYGLEISTDDATVPATDAVWGGKIYTLTPTQKLIAFIPAGLLSVTVERTPIAAGLDPDGIHLEDKRTGQRIAGWSQSGDGLRTFTLAAVRPNVTMVCFRFTNDWMLNNGLAIDRDVLADKSTIRLPFEEVQGT